MAGKRHQEIGQLPPAVSERFDLCFFFGLKPDQCLAVFVDRLFVGARRGGGADELAAETIDLLLQSGFALGQGLVLVALTLELLLDVLELRARRRLVWR